MAEYSIYFYKVIEYYGIDNILQFCEAIPPQTPYRGAEITSNNVMDKLVSLYGKYEIAFETVESFINEFQRVWNTNINVFLDKLNIYEKRELDLNEYKHNYEMNDNGDSRFSDTPNLPMNESDTNFEGNIYLTTRDTYKNGKTINDNMQLNKLQKYNDLANNITDPLIEFCEKFDYLFSHLTVIKETYIRRF